MVDTASTNGSEFVAALINADQIIDLQTILGYIVSLFVV
jgi:hypothetical protein